MCSWLSREEDFVVGRDTLVTDIIGGATLERGDGSISVLPILGMGGLGKTTVAKLVYGRIEKYFDAKRWLYVSPDSGVTDVLKKMLHTFRIGAAVEDRETLCTALREELNNKKYLLVLDDVWWTESSLWEEFVYCLRRFTSRGCCILLTARNTEVTSLVRELGVRELGVRVSVLPFHMPLLSHDNCWEIILRRAVLGEIEEEQERIGKEIAIKCGGLPLAAKVLGFTMRNKTSDEWMSILKSSIWNWPEGELKILSILKLSFDALKSPALKLCFAFLSKFGKGFKFKREDLILMWMAQGWLRPSPEEDNLDMEDIGAEYFDILLANSFFQDVATDSHGKITSCKLHDLVYALAEHVSKSEWDSKDTETKRGLRFLFVQRDQVLFDTLPSFGALRILKVDLNIDKLPESIGKLKHLRYLDISRTCIKTLPKSIGKLDHLQTLRLNS